MFMTDQINLKLKMFHEAKAPVANGLKRDETLVLLQFIGGAANG